MQPFSIAHRGIAQNKKHKNRQPHCTTINRGLTTAKELKYSFWQIDSLDSEIVDLLVRASGLGFNEEYLTDRTAGFGRWRCCSRLNC